MAVCRGGVSFWVGCLRSHGCQPLIKKQNWNVWQVRCIIRSFQARWNRSGFSDLVMKCSTRIKRCLSIGMDLPYCSVPSIKCKAYLILAEKTDVAKGLIKRNLHKTRSKYVY